MTENNDVVEGKVVSNEASEKKRRRFRLVTKKETENMSENTEATPKKGRAKKWALALVAVAAVVAGGVVAAKHGDSEETDTADDYSSDEVSTDPTE